MISTTRGEWKHRMDDIVFFNDIPVKLNADTLMEMIQLRKSLRSSEDFNWAVEHAKDLVHPRVLFGAAPVTLIDDTRVTIGDQEFTSRILRVNVDSCKVVHPFIATIGPELENVAAKQEKLTRKFFLELVGDFTLMTAVHQIEEKIKEVYEIGRGATITPGELENWPISEQVPLFNLFGNTLQQLGVELTSSKMMKPRKSRSGIVFETQRVFIQCQLCKMDRCPGRSAKYMPEKYAEYDLPIPK